MSEGRKLAIGDKVEAFTEEDHALGFCEPMVGVIKEFNGNEYLIDDGLMVAWYAPKDIKFAL